MNCLYCYQELRGEEAGFHINCSKQMFGSAVPPLFPYNEDQIKDMALQIIRSQIAVTGVQAKLSLDLEVSEEETDIKRFTIVGLWGNYILKPPTTRFQQLPEIEDLTMHLARIAKIATVPHSLIRIQSGQLAYITRRIDRYKKSKLHMEDMCQLTGKLSEDKYRGSYEQIAKAILQFSVNPVLDIINFFEQVIFSFLTGNADMHLKNFSLIKQTTIGYVLAPAYDMVATALVNPADEEELALTLNGKKRKLKRADFEAAFKTMKLNLAVQRNMIQKFEKAIPAWIHFIESGFINTPMKEAYKDLIRQKWGQLMS